MRPSTLAALRAFAVEAVAADRADGSPSPDAAEALEGTGVTWGHLRDLVAPRSPALPASGFVAVSGGATFAPLLAAAAYRVAELMRAAGGELKGGAGVSAGGLAVAALVFGVPLAKIEALFVELLAANRVLDRKPGGLILEGWGVCHWEVIRDAAAELFGAKTTMGDAPLPLVLVVTDAYFKRPIYLSKRDTPKVTIVDGLARTSSIWPFAPMLPMPSHADVIGNRRVFDGGFVDNFPNHVFDHLDAPTVGLRLGGEPAAAVRLEDLDDAIACALEALTWSSQQSKSKRDDSIVIDVDTSGLGSGFDFNLKPSDVRNRMDAGTAAVDAYDAAHPRSSR